MHVFGSSGVRGVANDGLTPAYVLRIARAVGTVWTSDRVAIARDTRTTGQQFANAAVSGLESVGFDVDRLGELPTPGLQAYCDSEAIPGLMVTASHNPPAYNGVKLIGDDGVELSRTALETVEEALARDENALASWADVGTARRVDGAGTEYVAGVLDAVDRDTIIDADLTVVVDPGHGAGTHTSPDFFRKLGCTVHTVNAQPDGYFPGRDPEPIAPNLTDLAVHVDATDADLGIAHDGDADRARFVDERGELVNGDSALAALVEAGVEPGDDIVPAVNASQRVVDVTEAADATLHLTPIGSTNIITRIRALQADGDHVAIAGEGNGGIFYPGYRIARDGAYTAAKFCELVATRPASAIASSFDDYVNVRETVGYADEEERARMIGAIEGTAREAGADLDTTDGYRLNYGDGWVLARPSGTEPLIRIYAEARTDVRAEELVALFSDAIARVRA